MSDKEIEIEMSGKTSLHILCLYRSPTAHLKIINFSIS